MNCMTCILLPSCLVEYLGEDKNMAIVCLSNAACYNNTGEL